MAFNLIDLDDQAFEYVQIGGPEYLGFVKDYAVAHLLSGSRVR